MPHGCFWLHNQWGNNACSLMHDSLGTVKLDKDYTLQPANDTEDQQL